LARVMGVNPPSIYIAFGNKRGLFEAVLDRYQVRRAEYQAWFLSGATAREVAERMLFGAIEWLIDPDEPPGCLLVQAGLAVGPANPDIPQELARRRTDIQLALARRFSHAKAQGDLAKSTDPAELARFIQAVFVGLSVEAATGASRADLCKVAERALAGWRA